VGSRKTCLDKAASSAKENVMLKLRYLPGVVTLELDVGKCVGCGMCAVVCPHEVFTVADGKAVLCDRDACMECGACARNCPAEALSVRAGVGCATGVLIGMLRGAAPACDCSQNKDCC